MNSQSSLGSFNWRGADGVLHLSSRDAQAVARAGFVHLGFDKRRLSVHHFQKNANTVLIPASCGIEVLLSAQYINLSGSKRFLGGSKV
jgi:hypothetical protein